MSQDSEVHLEQVKSRIERVSPGAFAGALGIELVSVEKGGLSVAATLSDRHLLMPGGLIHAGTVFGLADTAAGWGCLATLPAGMAGFTTIEGKANLTASATVGDILTATAKIVHSGRTTQVWDVEVARERQNRTVGLYRCTQMLLAEDRIRPDSGTPER